MKNYKYFADVYDLFMEDIPYDEWVSNIINIWKMYKKNPSIVLDLACGTGNITLRLDKLGYDMIGVDNSEEMLLVAKEKSPDVLFLNQDMRELDLFGTVDSCICLCDSLNYIIEKDELKSIFKKVNMFLNPKGLFIFDLNTEYKFKNILSGNSYSKINEDAVCVWENFYDDKNKISEYYTNFFIKENNGLYKRTYEFHYEKAYENLEIKNLIEESGLEFLDMFDALTFEEPTEKSERIYFIAQEKGK